MTPATRVSLLPIFEAVYTILRDLADVTIPDVIAPVLAAGTFAGSDLSDTAQRNLIRRCTEIMFRAPDRYPKFAEVGEDGEVIWPPAPEEDIQPLLDEMARRAAREAR
jgi:hypothetical protein